MHANSVSTLPRSRYEPLILAEEISHRTFDEYSRAIAGKALAGSVACRFDKDGATAELTFPNRVAELFA